MGSNNGEGAASLKTRRRIGSRTTVCDAEEIKQKIYAWHLKSICALYNQSDHSEVDGVAIGARKGLFYCPSDELLAKTTPSLLIVFRLKDQLLANCF